MYSHSRLLPLLVGLAFLACSEDQGTSPNDPPPGDAGSDLGAGSETGSDATADRRTGGDPDLGVPDIECGSDTLPTASIIGTEGIAIAADGTTYYSQSQAVGRVLPGGVADNAWVALTGETTVWGLAIRSDGMLFVAGPSSLAGTIYRIDTALDSPVAEVLDGSAGQPNGLIVGPDGAVYYSDFSGGHVYRVDDAGARTQVTVAALDGPNGLFFEDETTLLVLEYFTGDIHRLTLDEAAQEMNRQTAVSMFNVNPDGIGRDTVGRFYVTNNSAGTLLRYDATWSGQEVLATGISAAANLVFGRGNLDCNDIYVTSAGALFRYAGDAFGSP